MVLLKIDFFFTFQGNICNQSLVFCMEANEYGIQEDGILHTKFQLLLIQYVHDVIGDVETPEAMEKGK